MMVDRCVRAGLEVPELPVAVQERMRVILPFAAPVNPVDVTGKIGAGGVLVELIRDRALALAPLDHTATARLLAQTRASQLLQPVRGRPLRWTRL
jgi:acyl-CoA synthetase (NDP forming)